MKSGDDCPFHWLSDQMSKGQLLKGEIVGHQSGGRLDAIFKSVGQKLREGRSSEAEKILLSAIDERSNTPDNFANLKRLLSFTLETAGIFASLGAVVAALWGRR